MDADAQVAKDDLTCSVELASSLIQQLGEAFAKLESHKDGSEDKVAWGDIEAHFRQMESIIMKKYEDVKAKEKEFMEKESETRRVIAEREAEVHAKEKGMLDEIQDLKDAAVAAIMEARASRVPESADPANNVDGNENKVSSSHDGEHSPLHTKEEGHPQDVEKNTENTEGLNVKANRYTDLIRSCELMDAERLVSFMVEYHKDHQDLSGVSMQLSVALSSVAEPGRLVLESLKGFFPSDETISTVYGTEQGGRGNDSLRGLRQCCLVIMESFNAMMAKASPRVDEFLNHEIKEQAKAIAVAWKPKLAVVEATDAANMNQYSLEAEGFLRLLATFRIGSEFEQDELCKLILAISYRHKQATELCRSLELTQKIPDIVEVLINSGKPVDAVHLIQGFQLNGTYPPIPLLKGYLKDVRRNAQGKSGDASLQVVNNSRELSALKHVVKCIKQYKLQSDYPLFPLETRIAQLLKSKANDKKRVTGELSKYQQITYQQPPKKARTNGWAGSITRTPPASYLSERPPSYPQIPDPYSHPAPDPYSHPAPSTYYNYPVSTHPAPEIPERYPHANPTSYSHQPGNQGVYAAPAYYYPQDEARTTSTGYASTVPTYASYAGSSVQTSHPHQPYM